MLCFERSEATQVTNSADADSDDDEDHDSAACTDSDGSGVYETDAEDLLEWEDAEEGPVLPAFIQGDFSDVAVIIDEGAVQVTQEAADAATEEALCDGMNVQPIVTVDKPSDAPWCNREGAVNQIKAALRERPTLPSDDADPDSGELFPCKHCAFKGCTWLWRWMCQRMSPYRAS